jgi:hypothetical protein
LKEQTEMMRQTLIDKGKKLDENRKLLQERENKILKLSKEKEKKEQLLHTIKEQIDDLQDEIRRTKQMMASVEKDA